MAHQLADGQGRLARRAEGRPVVGHPVFIGQQTPVDAARDHQGHHRLARREDRNQRILGEGLLPRQIGGPGPQVQRELAVNDHGEARGQLVQPLGRIDEVGGEGVLHRVEAGRAEAVDFRQVGHGRGLARLEPVRHALRRDDA
ncbi:hypothetical protein D3C72_1603540 [compost metagenome]